MVRVRVKDRVGVGMVFRVRICFYLSIQDILKVAYIFQYFFYFLWN